MATSFMDLEFMRCVVRIAVPRMEGLVDIAALCAWLLTAAAGLFILGTWIAGGGVRRVPGHHGRHRRLPPALVFGHLLLAASGLVVWVVYVVLGHAGVAWAGFVILIPVAGMGLTMFIRWVPSYRERTRLGVGPGAAHRSTHDAAHRAPPEHNIPVAIVGVHGVLAVTTVVLVLLTALGVGRS